MSHHHYHSHYNTQVTHTLCGCWFIVNQKRVYLPQVDISAHTTIIGTSSRTTLRQTFANTYASKIEELRYAFPLYDGVSIVGFKCTVGGRVIEGEVQERAQAKATYDAAKASGQTAGLLEQSVTAADVFSTKIGNVPANEKVFVDITYLGELAHDAEIDGVRFTIPSRIAPRYGAQEFGDHTFTNVKGGDISVTIDVEMPAGSSIKSVQSPSHPIAVNVGTTSAAPDADPSFQKATASLTLGSVELETDFVVQVVATNLGEPTALLETHSTIPNQRAIIATLVPKFALPAEKPEIVFICDRSGSMGRQIDSLKSALNIFLKSLPVGVKFNICSFGSRYEFLWSKSKLYTQATLDQATAHVATFAANFGGTEMYQPIEETFKRRYSDLNLEVFVLTDGEIWAQDELFAMMNKNVGKSKGAIRIFSLGVGSGCSTSLVEGIARTGKGFAQFVQDGEKMDKKIVRMLKASLFPHITDYALEVKYGGDSGDSDDFVLIEKVEACHLEDEETKPASTKKKIISLFDKDLQEDDMPPADASLPALPAPRYLQTPAEIPPLFPFSRTTVYVLLSDACPPRTPTSVILRGTSAHGPLELEIPITTLHETATTIHQLGVRKELKELEEGRGWVSLVKSGSKSLKDKYPGRYDDMVERESVRLGTTFQVSGKWCSFVAIEKKDENGNAIKDGEKDAPPGYETETIEVVDIASMPLSMGKGGMPFGGLVGSAPMLARCSPMAAPKSKFFSSNDSSDECEGRGGVARGSAIPKRDKFLFSSDSGDIFSSSSEAFEQEVTCAVHHSSAKPQGQSAPKLSAGPSKEGGAAARSAKAAMPAAEETAETRMSSGNARMSSARKSSGSGMGFGMGFFSGGGGSLGPQPTGFNAASYGAPAPPMAAMAVGSYAFGSAPPPPSPGRAGGMVGGMPQMQIQAQEQQMFGSTGRARKKTSGGLFGSFSKPRATPPSAPAAQSLALDGAPSPSVFGSQPASSPSLPTPERAESPLSLSGDPLQDLTALQLFEGNWTWTAALEKILGVSQADAVTKAKTAGLDAGYGDVLATACAVAYFKSKLAAEADAWEMIVEKAEDWLQEKSSPRAALTKAVAWISEV